MCRNKPPRANDRAKGAAARNRESRQTTTTAESGGGGLVSVFAPPYGEDEPPAFLIGTKTPKRGHEGRIIGTKRAKRGHENAGQSLNTTKTARALCRVKSFRRFFRYIASPRPLRAAGAKIEQPQKGKASTPPAVW